VKQALQVDVAFGDAITPAAVDLEYPTLLDMPAPIIRAYPHETVIAEKLHAMVVLGIANSRMKDFFDLWLIARSQRIHGPTLVRAIAATFERRSTQVPADALAMTEEFSTDREKQTQWSAFIRRNGLQEASAALEDVVSELRAFLMSPLETAASGGTLDERWNPEAGWVA
jgi:hypothetical protein